MSKGLRLRYHSFSRNRNEHGVFNSIRTEAGDLAVREKYQSHWLLKRSAVFFPTIHRPLLMLQWAGGRREASGFCRPLLYFAFFWGGNIF